MLLFETEALAAEEAGAARISHRLCGFQQEAEAGKTEAAMLRVALAAAAERSSSLRGLLPGSLRGLRHEAAGAEEAEGALCEELAAARAQCELLEQRRSSAREESDAEWAAARKLRRRLDDQGWGLAWLRSSARGHVEDLRGSVEFLEQQIELPLQPPASPHVFVRPLGHVADDLL